MQTNRWKYYFFSVCSKVVALYAIKAYRESRSIAPFILNLVARYRSVVSFTLHLLRNKRGIH